MFFELVLYMLGAMLSNSWALFHFTPDTLICFVVAVIGRGENAPTKLFFNALKLYSKSEMTEE